MAEGTDGLAAVGARVARNADKSESLRMRGCFDSGHTVEWHWYEHVYARDTLRLRGRPGFVRGSDQKTIVTGIGHRTVSRRRPSSRPRCHSGGIGAPRVRGNPAPAESAYSLYNGDVRG